ncbi:MAG: hypothetical protein EP343_08455 [Deltaproteobacteria bacterium]|nr:MAG: hypothetical protein EP343_08455 [Deltaproteobacteria bacterium]
MLHPSRSAQPNFQANLTHSSQTRKGKQLLAAIHTLRQRVQLYPRTKTLLTKFIKQEIGQYYERLAMFRKAAHWYERSLFDPSTAKTLESSLRAKSNPQQHFFVLSDDIYFIKTQRKIWRRAIQIHRLQGSHSKALTLVKLYLKYTPYSPHTQAMKTLQTKLQAKLRSSQ